MTGEIIEIMKSQCPKKYANNQQLCKHNGERSREKNINRLFDYTNQENFKYSLLNFVNCEFPEAHEVTKLNDWRN